MNKKYIFIIIGIILIILLGFLLYKEITSPKIEKKTEIVTNSVDEFKEEIDKVHNGESSSPEEFVALQNELIEKYSKPESAIEYLISISMMEEINLYPEAFDPDVYSKDIFGRSEPRKDKLIEDIMKRLTRDGTIEKIEYINEHWTTSKDMTRIVTDFYYKDLEKPIRVSILVKKIETTMQHGDHEEEGIQLDEGKTTEFYYISTSAWEIINTIEKGASSQ